MVSYNMNPKPGRIMGVGLYLFGSTLKEELLTPRSVIRDPYDSS
jgi:hypothetical protein